MAGVINQSCEEYVRENEQDQMAAMWMQMPITDRKLTAWKVKTETFNQH